MKLAGCLVLMGLAAAAASASTIRDLEPESVELANVLGHCPNEYAQASQKGVVISKVVYIAPRPSNPKVRVEAWNLHVSDELAPAPGKVLAHFIVSRTIDSTGTQTPKVNFNCEFIAL